MKKLNTKGFGIAAILIVVVIVGLIGAVGWLVYDRQNSMTETTNSTSNASVDSNKDTSNTESSKTSSIEIAALGIKVNDPDGRSLQLHAEKICGAECDTEDSYFIRDNDDYFSRCEYPAGISKLDENSIKDITENPDTYTAKHTKKIGDNYYYVFPGSNFQSACDKLQDGDEQYEDIIRQYILDNIVEI